MLLQCYFFFQTNTIMEDSMRTRFLGLVFVLSLVIATPFATAAETISFGVPPWPGVTVKTHVATEILKSMGYESKLVEVGPPIIYKSMSLKDMDVYLAAWTPQQNPMLEPQVEAGKVAKVRSNLSDALIGMCVSEDAWQGGVRTVADLHKHSDKFSKTIYDIEAGTGMHTAIATMIKEDIGQLKGWKHVGTTTPMMLAAVENRIAGDEWVVFGCWKPHWMGARMNIRFLEGIPGTEELISASKVFTVTRSGFAEDYPEIQKLLERFVVTSDIQSEWINQYGYQKKPAAEVAKQWIAANIDMVADWLKGVKTVEGNDAATALRATFAK